MNSARLRVAMSLTIIFLLHVATPAPAITFDTDYATFADLEGDGSRSYVELYVRIDRWSLGSSTTESERRYGFVQHVPDTVFVGFTADVVAVSADGDTVIRERHIIDQPADANYSGTAYDDLFTTWGYYLPPGSHALTLTLSDHYADAEESASLPMVVRGYAGAGPTISDIELALSVARDESGGRFTKNGLAILPNARRQFGYGAPVLWFYGELYHLDESVAYELTANFLDSTGAVARTVGPFPVAQTDGMGVAVKGVNVMGYADGRYSLRLQLAEVGGEVVAERETQLRVSRVPSVTPVVADRFRSDVGWIASSAELREFDRASRTEKAAFIEQFWNKRDPMPGTALNEGRIEHYRRLSYADERFHEVGRPGRDSDLGRVYVKYGPPGEIEHQGSSVEMKEYQVWRYTNIAGSPIFVFIDMAGTGTLTLVHSTARDEVSNPSWRELAEPYEGTFQRRERRNQNRDVMDRDL